MESKGIIDSKHVYFGNRRLLEKEKISTDSHLENIEKLETEGKTVMLLAVNKNLVGLIAVSDTLKKSK